MSIILVDAKGIAIVVDQQSAGIGDCNEQDSEVVRAESMHSTQEKITGRRFKQCSHGPQTYKRKKRCLAGSKSANIKKDDHIVPTVSDADGRKKYARVRGVRGSSMKRAPEVPGEYPTYTRRMKKSNVVSVYWLHISSDFCRRYLPKYNAIMTLEDEDGQHDHVRYISGSYGLSSGWKDFAIKHSLKVGDTVVFQLVKPTKFKVYIKREKEFTTTDDNVRSMKVTTKASSSAVGDDANALVREEAVDGVDCTTAASSREDLAASKKILESFELLGMDVGFLRKRVDNFLGLPVARSPTDEQPLVDRKGYEEVNFEKGRATEKVWALKSKMVTLNDDLKALEIEMGEMESSAENIAQAIREIATAPW